MVADSNIGVALRRIRERLGVSIVSVARRAGIGDAMLSRIERGERMSPHFTTVAKIALVLGVSLDQVAEEAGIKIAKGNRGSLNAGRDIQHGAKVDTAIKHLERALAQLKEAQQLSSQPDESSSGHSSH